MAMPNRIARWTLDELDRLPDDGNRYELVRGELFVTPPPTDPHQEVVSALAELLWPYVQAHRVGRVYFPRSVVRVEDSQVEPDLMVRAIPDRQPIEWVDAPLPRLVVEVLSRTTRQRDLVQKRALYRDSAVPDYWIVDREARAITVVRPGADDVRVTRELVWHPDGAAIPLVIDVAAMFRAALGNS